MTEQTGSPFGVDYGAFAFGIKQFMLLSLAESVSHAVPSGKGQPVLGCFRVKVSPGSLQVAATDNSTQSAFAATPAVTCASQDEHVLYADAKRLLAILREAPPGNTEVEFTVKKNQAVVTAGGYTATLKLPDPTAYPELPDISAVTYASADRQQLLGALRAVRYAVCKDASQPSLTQVAITGTGDDCVVTASDRLRLARSPLPGFPLATTIGAAVLDDVTRLLSGAPLDTIEVGEIASAVVFRVGAVVLAVNKRTAQFPDMDKQLLAIALKENDQKLTVDRAELAKAVSRVAINADAKTSAIALRVAKGAVTVESRDKDGNSAQESVLASWAASERVLVVNHGYLADMLAAHPSQSCEFLLGPDVGKRLANLLLVSGGTVQVLTRMPAALLGY